MILKKVWATESTNEITPNICCYFHCCCLVCHMTTPGRPNMGGGSNPRAGQAHFSSIVITTCIFFLSWYCVRVNTTFCIVDWFMIVSLHSVHVCWIIFVGHCLLNAIYKWIFDLWRLLYYVCCMIFVVWYLLYDVCWMTYIAKLSLNSTQLNLNPN